jgi:hypothetical protein
MPTCGDYIENNAFRNARAAKIKADLIAKGLHPRSLKFSEVFLRKMRGK